MIFLALLLPGVYFILTGNVLRGIIAIILQCTVVGWIPMAIWAVMYRNSEIRKGELKEQKKQMDELTAAVRENKEDKE